MRKAAERDLENYAPPLSSDSQRRRICRRQGVHRPTYCCSRRLNERLHNHCSMFRCSVNIGRTVQFFMVVHCSMFVVRCSSCIGSKMRDSGPIVQKSQNSPRIDAFFPTITLLLTRSMQNMTIWRCTKRINERWNMSQIINLKRCVGWPTKNMQF